MDGLVFIPSKNEFINFNHVVFAKYEPAFTREAGIDDCGEAYPERDIPSKLIIITTELESEESSNYEGTVNGVCATSVRHAYKGPDAELLFDEMKHWSINLSQ
jgi:hypothetical protein